MKQKDFERVCREIAQLCDKLYLGLDKGEIKNKSRLLGYALIFQNMSKTKLRRKKEAEGK